MTNTPLQKIPGVGKNMEGHLQALGIRRVEDLRGQNPQELYGRDCALHGYQDRCVLYVYRCAVYFAQTPQPDPEKCRWWNWKDGALEAKD
ncbi:MAG: helix-hairpin-helix domain-containing protein [Oscillospiraceae bacterium]|nr:helix-hairpin-helix domain-containing protein [Oscillospiraceae bacterium]